MIVKDEYDPKIQEALDYIDKQLDDEWEKVKADYMLRTQSLRSDKIALIQNNHGTINMLHKIMTFFSNWMPFKKHVFRYFDWIHDMWPIFAFIALFIPSFMIAFVINYCILSFWNDESEIIFAYSIATGIFFGGYSSISFVWTSRRVRREEENGDD